MFSASSKNVKMQTTKDDDQSRYYTCERQQLLVLYGDITFAWASLQWNPIRVDSRALFAACEVIT